MIEQLEALTSALKDHTKAMTTLATAMRENANAAPAAPGNDTDYEPPVYWINNKTGEYGECENQEEWLKLKKKNADAFKVPKTRLERFAKEQEDNADEPETEDKKPSADKSKSDKKTGGKAATAAKDKKAKADESDDAPDVDIPEVDEQGLIDAFKSFMSSDLDKAERDERIAFVKPMLERFGVGRATELKGKDMGIAVRLLQLKEEGFDIDPTAAPWDPIQIIADCESGETSGDDDLV